MSFGYVGGDGAIATPDVRKYLYFKQIEGRGRGVFCSRAISRGEIIDVAPVVVIPERERAALEQTQLTNYYFKYHDAWAVVLGIPSLLNHDKNGNVHYHPNLAAMVYVFYAIRDIPDDTELLLDYSDGTNAEVTFTADGNYTISLRNIAPKGAAQRPTKPSSRRRKKSQIKKPLRQTP
jgi:hypothetical protein